MAKRPSPSLLRVLTEGHRACRQGLLQLAREPAAQGIDAGEYDRLGLRAAVHLVGEEVLVDPVFRHVLASEGPRATRRSDVLFVIRLLARAAEQMTSREAFARTLAQACGVYEELTNRTQIEVLPYLHYVFGRDEERRVAALYPRLCARTVSRYQRQRPQGVWHDPKLPDTVQRVFLEELGSSGLDWVPLEPSATGSVRAVPAPRRGALGR